VTSAKRRNEVYQSGYFKNQFSEAQRVALSMYGTYRRGGNGPQPEKISSKSKRTA
jgi:hypothetical protein